MFLTEEDLDWITENSFSDWLVGERPDIFSFGTREEVFPPEPAEAEGLKERTSKDSLLEGKEDIERKPG